MKGCEKLNLWNREARSLLRIKQELEDKSYRLSVFQEFCRIIVSASTQEIKKLLLSTVGIISHSTEVSLALAKDGTLYLDSVLGKVNRDQFMVTVQNTPIWQSFLTGRTYYGVFIGEVSVSAVYPLVTKEGIHGVLSIHTLPNNTTSDERYYIESLVNLAAVALQQAFQYEQEQIRMEIYQDKAIHDNLTGLYNRYYLQEYVAKELEQLVMSKAPYIIVILDIDHFKEVNDQLGHPFGDLVLKEISSVITGSLRGKDTAFRYGGEEFLIVLNTCTLREGAKVADRLRVNVEQNIFKDQTVERKVTVSLGVAQWQDGDRMEDVIARADQALYKAKHGGRNRVWLWEESINNRGNLWNKGDW